MVTGSSSSSVRRDAEAVLRPDPRRHVSHILGWVFCWPWDLVWMLIVHNPIQEILCIIANEIRSTFDDITRGELQDIERDFVCDRPIESQPVMLVTQSTLPKVAAPTEEPAKVEATAPARSPIGALGPLYPEDPWYGSREVQTGWHIGNDGGSALEGVLRQVRQKGRDS